MTRVLVAIAVGLILCACGKAKEMSNQVIVQNEAFTLTGDSIIQDTIIAYVPKSMDRIESNITLGYLDSVYHHADSLNLTFVKGNTCYGLVNYPVVCIKNNS